MGGRGAPRNEDRSLSPSIRPWVGDLVLAAGLFIVVSFHYGSAWSSGSFAEAAFRQQYERGVYASRALGRELVLVVHDLLDRAGSSGVLGRAAPVNGDLFDALVLVNGVAFVALALVLGAEVRGALGRTARSSLVHLMLLVVTALSFHVVTPYDALSLLLILGCLVLAGRSGATSLLAVPVIVLAVLTRETGLLAAAALVAVAWVRPDLVRRRTALTCAVAAGLTYGVLKLVTRDGVVLEGSVLNLNLHDAELSAVGVGAALLMAAAWLHLRSIGGLDARALPDARSATTALRGFWVLTVPYWATSIVAGYWFESLRLVVPLLLVDAWIRLVFARSERPTGGESGSAVRARPRPTGG